MSEAGKILLVDDEQDTREFFEILLGRDGHTVHAVGDSQQALELVEKNKYDLMLCDLVMPHMMGSELISKVVELKLDPMPLFFIVTGKSMAMARESFEGSTIHGIIEKPIDDIQVFMKTISNAVREAKQL